MLLVSACQSPQPAPPAASPPPAAFTLTIPGALAQLEMVPVRMGGTDAQPRYLWFSSTEVTWDVFDVFVFGQDAAQGETPGTDAVSRPSKPYIAMDRGFGHAGYPAISMSFRSAQVFCEWLSINTGRRCRLPTVQEWTSACGEFAAPISEEVIDATAWHAGNSDRKTHPVASKRASANGLYDMLGNAAEWCVDADGKGVVIGGSYRDPPTSLHASSIQHPSPAWNASDPQIPKSQWWLADGGFIGFRVVCEPVE